MADKDEIRDRSDIVEVVQTSVALKKRGRNFIGLCPFHSEKTPSFNVDPSTQTFKCFGCGAGGDVFTFVEKYQNMSFVEAAEFLARRAGLAFNRKGGSASPEARSQREQIFELNSLACEWFRQRLELASAARDYLHGRGIAHEAIQQFKLGFAPEGWDNLADYLRSHRQDLRIAELAGLVKQNEEQRSFFDMFRGRIIFPILDEQERVVGFGGRAMGEEQPKYLNTGETPVFAKSKLLYGLPYARRAIAANGCALLMEGYLDVIAAHQAGFKHAVATLGTSLTEEHAKRLARLAPENPTVVLVYDADSAGIKATLRASEILEKQGVRVRVAKLPAGDDPDSLLKRGETSAFQRALDISAGRVEYQLDRIVAEADQQTDAGRADMLRKITYILATIPSRGERDIYVNRVWRFHPLASSGPSVASEQLHRDAEALASRQRGEPAPRRSAPPPSVQYTGWQPPRNRKGRRGDEDWDRRPWRGSGREPSPAPVGPPPKVVPGPTAEERAEAELIRALAEPEWRESVLTQSEPDDFVTPLGRRFRDYVASSAASIRSAGGELMPILSSCEDQEFSMVIRQWLQEINANMAKVPLSPAAIAGCVRTLRLHRIERTQKEMAALLQGKSVLSREDLEQVREHQRILRQLKGTARSEGQRGE